jgi:hypothetical protein
MVDSGTRKKFRFFLRSFSFTEGEPITKLICSNFHPCRCITCLRTFRRDTYWFSDIDLDLRRCWSVISDMCLYSRIQNTVGILSLISNWRQDRYSSGLTGQSLSFDIVSLDWSSWTFTKVDSSGTIHLSDRILATFHIASYMNFHSGDTNRTSSP